MDVVLFQNCEIWFIHDEFCLEMLIVNLLLMDIYWFHVIFLKILLI